MFASLFLRILYVCFIIPAFLVCLLHHSCISCMFASPFLHFLYVCFTIPALFLSVLHYPGTYLIFTSFWRSFYVCFSILTFISFVNFHPCFRFISASLCLQTFCHYCKDPAFISSLLTIPALVLSALVSSVPHHLCLPFIFASPSLRSFYISFTISAFGLFWHHDL